MDWWRPGWELLLFCAMVVGAGGARAQTVEWNFDRAYDSDLVFLHALVNYAPSPDHLRTWERGLARSSSVLASVGSVTNRAFFTDVRLRLNEPLGDTGFRFLYDLAWLGGEHVDRERLDHFLGFEATLFGPVGVHALMHPTPSKESADLVAGIILTDASRERYVRASLRMDDFLYEGKNEKGGVSVREPTGIEWQGRWAAGAWEAFSEGRYQSSSRRTFPDPARAPLLSAQERGTNAALLRLRRFTGDAAYVELGVSHYDHRDEEAWRDAASSYRYENEVWEAAVRFVFSPGDRWRVWPAVRALAQRATARGREAYTFSRTDIMPALSGSYALSPSDALEVAYMGSASRRLREGADPDRALDRRRWADKAEVGWTHAFTPPARLRVSLSHEVTAGRFGGGNVRFVGVF